MDTELIRGVARGLRYRPLDHLISRSIDIADLERIEDAVRLSLGSNLPDGSQLAGLEPDFLIGQVVKYGFLDLRFTGRTDMLVADARSGVPLLRELGYLSGGRRDRRSACATPRPAWRC